MPECCKQPVLFPDICSKPVLATFSAERTSTDGGSVLLIPIDRTMELTARVAATIIDERQAGKVTQEILTLVRQRVFGIAAGYADGNDAARLAQDPMLKLACERAPLTDPALASQPTLSRFENAPRPRTLLQMGKELARCVLAQQKKQRRKQPPRRVVIDIDPTCDPTYGQQEFGVFNGFYGTSCFLPLVVTVSFDNEAEKFLVASVLRPGNASAMKGTRGVLLRLIGLLREYFPKARLRLRADSAFAVPELLDRLEDAGMEYVIALGSNSKLVKASAALMKQARRQQKQSGEKATLYGETKYQAGSWSAARRVVFKAEVVTHPGRDPRDNDRYVVTNLRRGAHEVFAEFHRHHDMENRIKELKCDLKMDRTSCESFWANQLRVLLALSAAALMQAFQQKLPAGVFAGAQMGTLRERLLKRAVQVRESVRRVVLEFSVHYPWQDAWRKIALAVGAVPG
jgi:hypothetical protein